MSGDTVKDSELRDRKIGFCAEKAIFSHNILKTLGYDSDYNW